MMNPPCPRLVCLLVLASLVGAGRCGALDVYVGPEGDDAASGTRAVAAGTQGPFATIDRARRAVRVLRAAHPNEDVTVHLLPGRYVLPVGLSFGPEDGGDAESAVRYIAETPGTVRLVGGVEINNWAPDRDAIVRAALPEAARSARQLFQGGQRLTLARSPNEGYAHIQDHAPDRPTTAFIGRVKDVESLSPEALRDARVLIWPGEDWFTADKGVVSFDPATRTLTLDSADGYEMKPGNRYYLYNALPLLDVPGEAVLAASASAVYAWPIASVQDQPVIASTADPLISVRGADRPVRNLHFRGLDLSIANGDVVRFEGAEDCSLRECLVENGRGSGVALSGHAQRITVAGNLIRFNGHHGVSLTGLGFGQPDVNGDNIIGNNHIHHNGRLVGHGYGVEINQSGRNRIEHNHIHHQPRYGISIKSGGFAALQQAVPQATRQNRGQYIWSRDNRIAYNNVHDVNEDSQDTGAIEAWQPGIGNVIDHNLIHDSGNAIFGLQSGIYLDDGADQFTVTNNVIWNIHGAGNDQPIFSKGVDNRVENNVLVVAPDNACAIVSGEMFGEACRSHAYMRNIVYFEPIPPEGLPAPAGGGWGQTAFDLHAPSTTLQWDLSVPAAASYEVFVRYAADNTGEAAPMDGRTTLTVGEGEPLELRNLSNTGGWGTLAWSSGPVATVSLEKGSCRLTWRNVKGGGMNIDALVLAPSGTYAPTDRTGVDEALWRQESLIVIQAERHRGMLDQVRVRSAWKFFNWSDDRLAVSDRNVFILPGPGESLQMKGAPAEAWQDWRAWGDGRFDGASVLTTTSPFVGDPWGAVLQPGSDPASLGFEPIDVSAAGLRKDFPERLERE